jgi:hypothetical protein
MGMSAIQSENGLIFQEKQYFDKWMQFFALAGLMMMINVGTLLSIFYIVPEAPSVLLILAGIPVLVFAIIGFLFSKMEMTTEVRHDGLHIRYRPTQRIFRHFPFDLIEFSQISKGGLLDGINNWRIRRYPNKTIYQCGSHEKVLIKLTNGKSLLIDSKRPDELITAISSMKKK